MKLPDDIKKFLDGRLRTIAGSAYPYTLDGLRDWLYQELKAKGVCPIKANQVSLAYLRNIILTEAAACYIRSIP